MKHLIAVLILVGWTTSCQAQQTEGLVIANVNIVDVDKGLIIPEQTVIIRGKSIAQITSANTEIEHDFPVIDGSGKFLIPGLIDSHVHTTAGPPNVLLGQLENTLKSGVTMVRDMGGDAVVIKEWQQNDDLEIPSIYSSAIFAGKSWIDNDRRSQMSSHRTIPGTTAWLRTIDAQEKIDEYLDEAKAFGLNGIKVYADLTADMLKQITSRAKEKGLPVYAHATVYPATPLEVVNSGVISVSHSERLLTVLDEKVAATYHADQDNTRTYTVQGLNDPRVTALMSAMHQNNVALDATLLVSRMRSNRFGAYHRTRLKTIYELTQMAYEAGVTILAGTDFMIGREADMANLHEELVLLVEEVGMTPIDALKAATINPAKVFDLKDYGEVKAGKMADLVLLHGNPLDEIEHTKEVFLVIKQGKPLD